MLELRSDTFSPDRIFDAQFRLRLRQRSFPSAALRPACAHLKGGILVIGGNKLKGGEEGGDFGRRRREGKSQDHLNIHTSQVGAGKRGAGGKDDDEKKSALHARSETRGKHGDTFLLKDWRFDVRPPDCTLDREEKAVHHSSPVRNMRFPATATDGPMGRKTYSTFRTAPFRGFIIAAALFMQKSSREGERGGMAPLLREGEMFLGGKDVLYELTPKKSVLLGRNNFHNNRSNVPETQTFFVSMEAQHFAQSCVRPEDQKSKLLNVTSSSAGAAKKSHRPDGTCPLLFPVVKRICMKRVGKRRKGRRPSVRRGGGDGGSGSNLRSIRRTSLSLFLPQTSSFSGEGGGGECMMFPCSLPRSHPQDQ